MFDAGYRKRAYAHTPRMLLSIARRKVVYTIDLEPVTHISDDLNQRQRKLCVKSDTKLIRWKFF